MSASIVAALNPRGPRAEEIEGLWTLMLWLGTATFVLFAFLLVRGLFRTHGTRDEEPAEPNDEPVSRLWLAGGGVALPSVVIGSVFVATVLSMQGLYASADDDPLVIEVTGHQWWWQARYPDSGVTVATEIHIPTDREVEFHLTSSDVIHSFWVPALGGKLDALPDHVNTLVLQADHEGVYRGACAEFCGLQHAKMHVAVVAMDPAEFDAWLAQQEAPAARVSDGGAEGFGVFVDAGCDKCHTIRGTDADGKGGPDLTHVGSRSTIASLLLPNDRASLARFISEPHAIKEGVAMPAAELSADRLDALVTYLDGLE